MSELLLSRNYNEILNGVITCASISHHAIARLVERGGVNPTTLSDDIFDIMDYCAAFAERALETAIDHSAMMSFMVPFKDGALVAVFMDMDPAQMHKGQERRRILSVWTWLDEGKLSDSDMERMGGFERLLGTNLPRDDVFEESVVRWIEGNARPWHFSDSTLGVQGQGEM